MKKSMAKGGDVLPKEKDLGEEDAFEQDIA